MKPYFPPCNERKSYWQENKYLTVNYLYKPQKRFNTLFEKLERARSLGGRQIQRRILEVSYIFTEKEDAVHARQIFLVKLSLEKHRFVFVWKKDQPEIEHRHFQLKKAYSWLV